MSSLPTLQDLHAALESQHRLMHSLLLEALRDGQTLDRGPYDALREALRRHIALEERVLLRALHDAGVDFPLAERLHRDHKALHALLAAEPDFALAVELMKLVDEHERAEEAPGGLFDTCAQHLDEAALLEAVRHYPRQKLPDSPRPDWLPRTRDEAYALADGRLPLPKASPPKP